MKKNIFLSLLCLLFFVGCKNKARRIWHRPPIQNENTESDISIRDYSITSANAYNDIFLDSSSFEKYITDNLVDDSISINMRDFYNVRNFEFAWFDSKGLTEQALGFRSLYKFNTDSSNKKLDKQLDELLLYEKKIDPTDSEIVKIELLLTKRFVQFSLETYSGTDMNNRLHETFVPIKKQSVLALADSILSNKDIEKYAARNPFYNDLKVKLVKYVAIYKQGGWPLVPDTKAKFILGQSYAEIPVIKKRLFITGDLIVDDTTSVFTTALQDAIIEYQLRSGITTDGKINPAVFRNMKVPVLKRIQQLLINMERMRWMPTQKEGKLILINIPEFMLHVTEGDKHVFHMPVVVGKEGHNTTTFSDDLTTIVFSPYWNIPRSIVKNEILPAMKKNSNYLKKHNMEIVSNGAIPEMRQLPGAFNSLGRVKFLFPNSFNIYFHDTPSKGLFEKDFRAASHGCIRLNDPEKLANYLLQNSPSWTPEKIRAAMNSTAEKWVNLPKPVPVIITYYTAWVDENRKMNFREDVYGNDSVYAAKMFLHQ